MVIGPLPRPGGAIGTFISRRLAEIINQALMHGSVGRHFITSTHTIAARRAFAPLKVGRQRPRDPTSAIALAKPIAISVIADRNKCSESTPAHILVSGLVLGFWRSVSPLLHVVAVAQASALDWLCAVFRCAENARFP